MFLFLEIEFFLKSNKLLFVLKVFSDLALLLLYYFFLLPLLDMSRPAVVKHTCQHVDLVAYIVEFIVEVSVLLLFLG